MMKGYINQCVIRRGFLTEHMGSVPGMNNDDLYAKTCEIDQAFSK